MKKYNKIIKLLEKQFHHLYPKKKLDCIEFEYQEDDEVYFNLIADGYNYVVKLDESTGYIYWDRYLSK